MRKLDYKAYIKQTGRKYPVLRVDFVHETLVIDDPSYWGKTSRYSFNDVLFLQYTGVRDIEGNKIYEDDLVSHSGGLEGRVYYDEAETSFILEPLDPESSYVTLGLQSDLLLVK